MAVKQIILVNIIEEYNQFFSFCEDYEIDVGIHIEIECGRLYDGVCLIAENGGRIWDLQPWAQVNEMFFLFIICLAF